MSLLPSSFWGTTLKAIRTPHILTMNRKKGINFGGSVWTTAVLMMSPWIGAEQKHVSAYCLSSERNVAIPRTGFMRKRSRGSSVSHLNYKYGIRFGAGEINEPPGSRQSLKWFSLKLCQAGDCDEGSNVTRYTITPDICPPTDPEQLRSVVEKHCRSVSRYRENKPVAEHTNAAFQMANKFMQSFMKERQTKLGSLETTGIILDSGCGTGRSTLLLAEKHPNHLVIGIDRSIARLNRNQHFREGSGAENSVLKGEADSDVLQSFPNLPNALLLRAELGDFWRCCLEHHEANALDGEISWKAMLSEHYILYPNPYPKASRVKNRWYAHPTFPILLDMGGRIIVRSNWKLYLDEFAVATEIWNEQMAFLNTGVSSSSTRFVSCGPATVPFTSDFVSLTNFENKYYKCKEQVYELTLRPESAGDL
jgi:tRNA (guanine-N7-)-methyltransferase